MFEETDKILVSRLFQAVGAECLNSRNSFSYRNDKIVSYGRSASGSMIQARTS